MVKQNIRIAIFAIFVFLGIWAIACAFIKLDICSQSLINLSNDNPIISITNENASYIEKHDITKVKIEYEKQKFDCLITFESQSGQYTNYMIFLPSIIPRSEQYIWTNCIIDSLNVYQYIFKK